MKTDRRYLSVSLLCSPAWRMTADDSRLISRLDRECFPDDEPFDACKHWHWIARYRGRIIGWSSARLWGADLFIDRQGVRTGWRRRGGQRRMLRAILVWARRHGFHRIVSYTHTTNSTSSNNFIACGFRTFDPAETFGEAFIHWEKTL